MGPRCGGHAIRCARGAKESLASTEPLAGGGAGRRRRPDGGPVGADLGREWRGEDRGDEVTSYKLQATSYKLQVTSYKLQATSYKLQATGASVVVADVLAPSMCLDPADL